VYVRLEKVNHIKRQRRYYVLYLTQNLFGEWCVIREWGRIGLPDGGFMVDYPGSQRLAEEAFEDFKDEKLADGYSPIPVQLTLF
jgi:predicted DNA-binding WGR domain protein